MAFFLECPTLSSKPSNLYASQIGKCVFLMLFMAHCIGCIFTMLIVDPNDNWLVAYDSTALTQTNFRRWATPP
jgi:hypothetical protein